MREADTAAFAVLMNNDEFLQRCYKVCQYVDDSMRSNLKILREKADLGKTVERVVQKYNAKL